MELVIDRLSRQYKNKIAVDRISVKNVVNVIMGRFKAVKRKNGLLDRTGRTNKNTIYISRT